MHCIFFINYRVENTYYKPAIEFIISMTERGSEREKSTNARSLFNIVGIYKLENELTHTRLVNSQILITNPHY